MQELIKLNNIQIKQPDEGLRYDIDTTFSADSTRVQSGAGHFTPVFSVESLTYDASHLTPDEVKQILQVVAKGAPFTLHYFSAYYGEWRDALFYVKRNSLEIGRLTEDAERFDRISFTMLGVNPID